MNEREDGGGMKKKTRLRGLMKAKLKLRLKISATAELSRAVSIGGGPQAYGYIVAEINLSVKQR